MGIKLKNAADAVQYLRDQAWLAVESRKGNRAERMHFCADLIAKMGQDLDDAIEMGFSIRMFALQAAREAAQDALDVYEAITALIDEMVDEQHGD